jgi:hypothetical protein
MISYYKYYFIAFVVTKVKEGRASAVSLPLLLKPEVSTGFRPYIRSADSKADEAALATQFIKVINEAPEYKHS